jgi:NAD(P)-dependent dehydrogenase (short-subunit alcohol dehydrogenase family)
MAVIFITGASSGIGKSTTVQLAQAGNTVYGAARRVDAINALPGVHGVKLDLTDSQSIQDAVTQVLAEAGHIDVLINNAGYGSYGAIEDVPLADVRRQFDVNLFGVAALTQAVLPGMRAQGHGRIINTSSMGGRFTTYFGAWYHATKYALEAFSDALRMEVAPFGIHVSIIEPGAIKTNWGKIAAEHLVASSTQGAYATEAKRAAKLLSASYSSRWLSNPDVIARAITKAATVRKPKTRYLVGFGAKPLVFLHTVLPTRTFDWLSTHYL